VFSDKIIIRKEGHRIYEASSVGQQKDTINLSLVVSYWADYSSEPHLHRREIEAAIAVNAANCQIRTVVVLLDGSNFLYNCSHFVEKIQRMSSLLTSSCTSQLKCVDRYEGQPTYYEMFHFSKNLGLQESINILANADMVFDETIGLAKELSKNVLLVLGTQGMHAGTPSAILSSYEKLTGLSTPSLLNLCERVRKSWDVWIFHPNDIKLNKKSFRDSQTKLPFYMNQDRAENSALHALLHGSKGLVSHNPCEFIHAWHYHGAEKTHKKGVGAVIHPRAKPSTCPSIRYCLNT